MVEREFGNLEKEAYISKPYLFWLEKFKEELIGDKDVDIRPILDERNFVCSFVIVDRGDLGWPKEDISAKPVEARDNVFGTLEYESEEFRTRLWQLLFIEPSHNFYVENPYLRDKLLAESLYLRYRNAGTYYGFSRYSGMYLFHSDIKGDDWFPHNILSEHFNSMYFQLANLLLCFRAALLEFSRRCSEVSQRIDKPDDVEKEDIKKELENLYSDFLKFNNKYWFCEVTAQEQGIEMFDLWNRNMGNKQLFDEVEEEIEALYDFSQSVVQNRLSSLTYLSLSAVVLAIFAIGFSVIGASFGWAGGTDPRDLRDVWQFALIGVGLGSIFAIIFYRFGWNILHPCKSTKKFFKRLCKKS